MVPMDMWPAYIGSVREKEVRSTLTRREQRLLLCLT